MGQTNDKDRGLVVTAPSQHRPATPLEAYLTGMIQSALTTGAAPLPNGMRLVASIGEDWMITGEIEVRDLDDKVRASILITEEVA